MNPRRAAGDGTAGARRGRHARQRGVSVIAVMLVVSIVGIVAAGLTAGLVGVTSLVRRHVAEQERTTVQRAYTAMLRDQRVPPGRGCEGAATSGAPTNDMRALAGHRRPVPGDPAHRPVSLYPAYIARPATRYHYYCTGAGVIITADAP